MRERERERERGGGGGGGEGEKEQGTLRKDVAIWLRFRRAQSVFHCLCEQ